MESEKYLIKNNKSRTTSYGSLRKEPTNNLINIKHKLINGETLQGISLKYGVSIENIKRANRLWSNDLAFIKDYLNIPLPKERAHEFDQNGYNENNTHNELTSQTTEEKDSYTDYLSKFDSLINQSKEKLKNLEASKSYDVNDDFIFETNKSPVSIKSTESTSSSNSRLRQAQEQLQKLEQEKDDLYEL